MSQTLERIIALIKKNKVRISSHGYDELSEDNILVNDLILSISEAVLVEDYPHYHKGPSVLILQKDGLKNPVHVVWGISKKDKDFAVLITAYRPDPLKWNDNFTRRLK